jgi:SOS response regulatory protein OraA/RecX
MDSADIIVSLEENVDIREEVIQWLNENGYLDDFKIYSGGIDSDYY